MHACMHPLHYLEKEVKKCDKKVINTLPIIGFHRMLKSSILFFFFLSFFLFISFLSTLQQQCTIFELDTGQHLPPGKHACPCMNWARLPSCSLCYGARCSHSLRGTMNLMSSSMVVELDELHIELHNHRARHQIRINIVSWATEYEFGNTTSHCYPYTNPSDPYSNANVVCNPCTNASNPCTNDET